jgi:tetratricopeptide (TPR) repeat protein
MLLLLVAGACRSDSTAPPSSSPAASLPTTQPAAVFAGSASCAECHPEAYTEWKDSHHGRAQRPLEPELDRPAFDPKREIKHASQTSLAEMRDSKYVLTTLGAENQVKSYEPAGVIGVDPLWQYLIPTGGGRLQVTELAFDPAKKEWFDVYGNEDRRPHEWGHWSQRGMNWNSMCAVCHVTAFEKNYDARGDSYHSAHKELGVGCESCHGPSQAHVDWQKQHPGQKGDPTLQHAMWPVYFDTCLACHSRRADLTGRFRAGEKFDDHYDLVLPDLTDTFYPDGQVREENFEGGAFSLSYMHGQSIRCIDCHGAHTAAPNVRSNALCLRCHENGIGSKMPIDEVAHGHHAIGEKGSFCYDCHMPQTAYMQRHWRRDHGMTIPDPVLTKEHGIPNACNRCHADKSVDWAIETTNTWYGQRMERPTRSRARLLARLKKGDTSAAPALMDVLSKEQNAAWRAVEAKFLGAALGDASEQASVIAALVKLLQDVSPIVQAAAVATLETVIDPTPGAGGYDVISKLRPLLASPSRSVRIRTVWTLRQLRPWDGPAATAEAKRAHADLIDSLVYNQDQPLGALHWAQYLVDTGRAAESLPWYDKAIRWDPNSAPFRHAYAMTLDALGRPEDALVQAARAAELEPGEALHSYALGLLYAELGRLPEARTSLRLAVERDPRQARYWYNLGLTEARLGDGDRAIAALQKACDLAPASADYVYAGATIHYQLGQLDQARAAIQRALQLDPRHTASLQLQQQLARAETAQ